MQRKGAWKPYFITAQNHLWQGVRSELDIRAQNLMDSGVAFKHLRPSFPNRAVSPIRSAGEVGGEDVEANDDEDEEEDSE